MIFEKLRALGPEYDQMAQTMEENLSKSSFYFWAYDSAVGEGGILTNVNVTGTQVPSDLTIEEYMEASSSSLSSEIRVIDQQVISFEQNRIGRVLLEFSLLGTGSVIWDFPKWLNKAKLKDSLRKNRRSDVLQSTSLP
jgi:hypothetical protein